MVADKLLALKVKRHRDGAVVTLFHITAVSAEHVGGMPASVEKQDNLFPSDETLFHCVSEEIGEDCAVALF